MSRRLKFALILFLAISLGSLVLSEVELPKGEPGLPPSLTYPMGTSLDGENMVTLNAEAVWDTVLFGLLSGAITTVITSLSSLAVYGRFRVRGVLVRLADAVNSLPRLPFLLVLALILGTPTGSGIAMNFFLTALVVSLTGVGQFMRQGIEFFEADQTFRSLREVGIVLRRRARFVVTRMGITFYLPAFVDGITAFTGIGVVGGVGDPLYPTLTTLLNVAASFLYLWWIFLVPALFRALLLVSVLILADEVRKNVKVN
jgi:peptide/nickel transport system permease protein